MVKKTTAKKAVVKKAVVKEVLFPVTVCELMKDLRVLKVKKGATVGDVLKEVGINIEGGMEHLRVNGGMSKLDVKVNKGDIITLVPHVNGGK